MIEPEKHVVVNIKNNDEWIQVIRRRKNPSDIIKNFSQNIFL